MKRVAMVLCGIVIGCTAPNPEYAPPTGDTGSVVDGPISDGMVVLDTSVVGDAATDLASSDLFGSVDLTALDAATPSDLTMLMDLTSLSDLTVLPDLTMLPKTPPSTGLIGYWPFESVAFNQTPPKVGTNSLTLSGLFGSGALVSGKVGSALHLDSLSCAIANAPTPGVDGLTSMTAMAWVYASFCQAGRLSDAYVVSKMGEFGFKVNCGTAVFAENLATATNKGWAGTGSETISRNAWHHLAITYDGTGVQRYIDGVPVGTPRPLTGALSPNAVLGTTYGFGVGCANVQGTGWTNPFVGHIDEVAIYNRALSATEIALYYAGTK